MKEKHFQSAFGRWLGEHGHLMQSSAFELKLVNCLSTGERFPFSRLRPHQQENLMRAKHGFVYYKIEDTPVSWLRKEVVDENGEVVQKDSRPMTRYTSQKPFDCVLLAGVKAYVGVLFYRPREKKIAYFIDIDVFGAEECKAKSRSAKSLTETEVQQLANFNIDLTEHFRAATQPKTGSKKRVRRSTTKQNSVHSDSQSATDIPW